MSKMAVFRFSLLVVMFYSCSQNPASIHTTADSTADSVSDSCAIKKMITPHLESYNQSKCKDDQPEGEKVLQHELRNDSLILKLRVVKDCNTKYRSAYQFSNDTLHISTDRIPNYTRKKDGSIDSSAVTIVFCHCYYEMSYVFSHVARKPAHILVDGQKLAGKRTLVSDDHIPQVVSPEH